MLLCRKPLVGDLSEADGALNLPSEIGVGDASHTEPIRFSTE